MAHRRRHTAPGERIAGLAATDEADRATSPQTLSDEVRATLDEARMVLPGIQALFGFQLIAVFSDRFELLPDPERLAHLGSLLLVTAAIALIMTPAAYDRIVGEIRSPRQFITLASRLITIAMVPLMLGIAVEIYVITLAVLGDRKPAAAAALAVAVLFAALWFALPWLRRLRASA